MPLTDSFFRSVGGRPIRFGNGSLTWNFGYRSERLRSDAEEAARTRAIGSMPRFAVSGKSVTADPAVTKAALYELWKDRLVISANGHPFTGTHQLTGSCVGAAGGNALMSLVCVQAITLLRQELPLVPFWLLPYGRSRLYLGDTSPGEGSTGSTFAKAAREDGMIPAKSPGLPSYTTDDGLTWGSRVEMAWSDGDAKQTMDLVPLSRRHLVKTVAQCADAGDVREAICNGFPVTCASMYAHDGGKVRGSPSVLMGSKTGSWSHQMSIQAWWNHPTEGEIFWLHNQWGLKAHGECPSGAPLGGVWITAADMSWICRDEVFAFSAADGFPAPAPNKIPWVF